MKILYFLPIIVCCTSCKIFRKSSEDVKFSAFRDSSSSVETNVDLQRTVDLTSNENLFAMKAQGFRSVTLDRYGNIKAEGENGVLEMSGAQNDRNLKLKEDLSVQEQEQGSVLEGQELDSNIKSDSGASTKSFSLLWIGIVVGLAVAMIGAYYIRKTNFKSIIGKLWSNFR